MSAALAHVVRSPRPAVVAAVTAALVLGAVASQSVLSLVILVADGIFAAGIVLAATGGGLWLVRLLGLSDAPVRWQLLLGAALGLGGLALLVLGLGVIGVLQPMVWVVLLVALGLAGLVRIARLRHRTGVAADSPAGALMWLWLTIAPFVALWVLVSTVPPGFLWAEEGWGYDVLEYHLQLPKEYLQAGRIGYAPHNVYANFPSNVEMLYLLGMVLRADVLPGAATASVLNAGLAALFVAAAWLAGRETSARAGVVSGAVAAGLGYVTYLSGIAYVENGLLFFGMMSVAAVLRAQCADVAPRAATRWMLAAGLFAGLCAGCKYTAVALVVFPLLVMIPIGRPARRPGVLRELLVFAAGAALSFAPWLVKNAAMTGNPVFPLLNGASRASPPGWGDAETAHFDDSHAPAPSERTVPARLRKLWEHVPGDHAQRYGPLIFVLAAATLVARRPSRSDFANLVMLIVQVAVWLFATHLYARFAVPFVLPLLALAGRAIECRSSPRWRAAVIFAIVAGAAFNLAMISRLYAEHFYADGDRAELAGAEAFFTDGIGLGHEPLAIVNRELPADARILLVGDAKAFYFQRDVDYCVVFNRNPFVEAVRDAATTEDAVKWLQSRGYTHVLVNWAEVERLRRSRYGFPAEITPALFERLTSAGLVHQARIETAGGGVAFADLYSVPSPDSGDAPTSRSSR